MNITAQQISDFESDIAAEYAAGKIPFPVHLRSGREEQLIRIFEKYEIGPDDYLFAQWDSHDYALLKGVDPAELKAAIMRGESIALQFPAHRMFCSGIVGSLTGVAAGCAWALKRQGSKARVFCAVGDMTAETGDFYLAAKYAHNFDLPVWWIVTDNGYSVLTKTNDAWGKITELCFDRIIRFQYENSWPHSGLKERVQF